VDAWCDRASATPDFTLSADGDALWYGVGVTLAGRFSPDEMTIVLQPSAFSLAAPRLGYGGTLTRIAVSRAEPVGPHRLWRSLAPVT
jgi:precorrin-6B methylase 1